MVVLVDADAAGGVALWVHVHEEHSVAVQRQDTKQG